MFKATCSQCGGVAEVPFQPRGDKPVYCRDCFAAAHPLPLDVDKAATENERARFGGLFFVLGINLGQRFDYARRR